ncbi:MAG: hypothetical protein JSR59_21780 [Proteobacteria bacterium]|nr:hypothetical protein [Pseudomonadota bacterium]
MTTRKPAKPAPGQPARAVKSPYELSVFVNCPFDDDYLPLLHAMVFAIHDCGFLARSAVEETGSNEVRVEKIVRIISECCYSVHDISRVEISASRLPRFNMPFERGLDRAHEPSRARQLSRHCRDNCPGRKSRSTLARCS